MTAFDQISGQGLHRHAALAWHSSGRFFGVKAVPRHAPQPSAPSAPCSGTTTSTIIFHPFIHHASHVIFIIIDSTFLGIVLLRGEDVVRSVPHSGAVGRVHDAADDHVS